MDGDKSELWVDHDRLYEILDGAPVASSVKRLAFGLYILELSAAFQSGSMTTRGAEAPDLRAGFDSMSKSSSRLVRRSEETYRAGFDLLVSVGLLVLFSMPGEYRFGLENEVWKIERHDGRFT